MSKVRSPTVTVAVAVPLKVTVAVRCTVCPSLGPPSKVMVQLWVIVPLVGKRGPRLLVVAPHGRVAVIDGLRGDDLVARMRERRQYVIPVLRDLVVEVVEHELLAASADVVTHAR